MLLGALRQESGIKTMHMFYCTVPPYEANEIQRWAHLSTAVFLSPGRNWPVFHSAGLCHPSSHVFHLGFHGQSF